MIGVTLRELENAIKEKPRMKWGGWRLYPDRYILSYRDWYHVDLLKIDCSAKLADLIYQINTKDSDNWDSNSVGDFVKATNDIINPQANCCSRGVDTEFDIKKICDDYIEKLLIHGHVW